MALRKDGNSRNNVSQKPYDCNNSFVKKMANQVARMMAWHSESQSVVSQNHDNLSNSIDESSNAPNAKRIRVDSDDTFCLPSTSRALNEACSPIQPINDLKILGTNRNRCIISSTPATQLIVDKNSVGIGRPNSVIPSTPANIFSSTSVQPSTEHQSFSSNSADSFENIESVNSSLTIPQFIIHPRHNVTVPAISKDVPSQVPHLDKSKLSGSFSSTNSRAPSFNVDVFSNSSRRLSVSVCERRNSSLSPFYSARTMYGGASALLPYGKQNVGPMRSASTSKLNLFAPRSHITIHPVPSHIKTNDQETMSAAARRILDTLEKYCSPVMDAKKIPVGESSKKDDTILSLQPLAKGVKRKLGALSQMTPSTTDLLRIKRKEQMQDSVSNARHVVSTVPESSIVAEDSDSSDSVDLDYSVFKEATKTPNSQKYVSKIRRKQEDKFDNSPVPPVKLPNAVLKITNLPKFDITDMFTFSKPLLLENLDQNVTETGTSTVTDGVQKSDSSSQTIKPTIVFEPPVVSKPALKDSNKAISSQSLKLPPVTVKNENNKSNLDSPKKPTPMFLTNDLTFSKSSSTKTPSWMCRVCLLESTEERCSSCTSTRELNTKPAQVPKPPKMDPPSDTAPPVAVSGWGDKFKPASDTWSCNECFVRSPNTDSKCVSCSSPKPGTNTPSLPPLSNSNELWKSMQKSAAATWKCDSCWVQNKLSEPKCAACGEPKEPGTSNSVADKADPPKPQFLFGIDKADVPPSSAASSVKFGTPIVNKPAANITFDYNNVTAMTSSATPSKPTVSFGFGTPTTSAVGSSNDSTSSTSTTTTFSFGNSSIKNVSVSAPQFAFGLNKVATPEPPPAVATSNALPTKNPLTDGFAAIKNNEAEKPVQNKKDAPGFNDVSSSTNNTRNPLLQKPTMATSETTTFNDTNIFKKPKASVLKSMSANKENGEDINTGNVSNNISSSTNESSSPKNSVMFPAFVPAGSSNMFGSNGFAKPDNNASIMGNNTTLVSSSVSNVFSSSFSTPATSKLTNDTQASMFAMKPKTESPKAKVNDDKGSKLFGATNSFAVSSSQPTATNSVFGSSFSSDTFGAKKSDTPPAPSTTFNSTPAFTFGTPAAASQQPISGGFRFNGPAKVEDSNAAPKYVFGSLMNANINNNSFGSSAAPTPFGFNPDASATEQSRPAVNSMFSTTPLKPAQPTMQPNNNSIPAFGNSMFGNAQQQQQPQTMNAIKKSGGFSFAVPNQVAPQNPITSFNNFANSTNENQDQSRLHANAAPAYTPFGMFGNVSSQNPPQPHNFNTTVPTSFNFGGNALTSFTAQPTSNNNPTPAVAARKIRKAVRRSAK